MHQVVEINNLGSFNKYIKSVKLCSLKVFRRYQGRFKTIKIIKSLMLLIMVGKMASILTQMYSVKVTLIYSFFPHLLHTLPFTSFSLLWACVNIFIIVFFFILAVTCPMYSGASAFIFLAENPVINPFAISSQKSGWTYLFLVCLLEVAQYKM